MARADISRVALRQVVSEEKHCVTTLITAAKETNRKSKDYQLRFCVIVRLQLNKLSAELNVLIQTFRYSPSEDDKSSFTDMQKIVTKQDSMLLFIPR